MEPSPRQSHLGRRRCGAPTLLLRMDYAPFDSQLHPSKHSCSFTLFPSVRPRQKSPGALGVLLTFFNIAKKADMFAFHIDPRGRRW